MAGWRKAMAAMLGEACLYVAGSPQSRRRQVEILRALDDRLRRDIGLDGPGATPSPTFRGEFSMMQGNTSPGLAIRDATPADMMAVQDIYAHHVLHGLATFEEEPPDAAEMSRRRAEVVRAGLPYLVAELQGRVVGYSYAAAYRPRSAYRFAIEDSVYVRDGLAGQGIGSALLSALLARCEGGRWRQMIAVIGDSANTGSIALHRRLGFRPAGTLEAVGYKLGRWVDTVLMQRPLGPGAATQPGDEAAAR